MKKYVALFLFLLFLARPVLAVDKPLGVEEFSSVEELALSLSSYFPKVQGEVKAVQGDRLTLSLSKKDGLIPGMELTLWRDGREILHPVTGAVIGHAEDEIGTVEIATVGETTSSAVLKKKVKDAKQGDRARITPRKINLAIVPIHSEYPDIVKTLGERLNEFGRFNVLDQAKVDAFVKNGRTMGTLVVKELGRAFGLDAVVSLGLYPSEGKLMATARIFYPDDANQLDTVVAMLNLKNTRKEPVAGVKPFFTPVKEEKVVTSELPALAKFFTTGDFDGDGKPEFAFSDGERVQVYRNEPSGWREVWTEIVAAADKGAVVLEWQEQSAVAASALTLQHINLDSADINGNGRPEIYVTALVNGKVTSSVIEFQEGTYRRTGEMPGFLRVASLPGTGAVLLGQAYDPVSFYSGPVRQFAWSEGKYLPGEEVRLPKGMPLYGWTFANLGESSPLLVVLDDDDHLLVYSKESMIWKSAEPYPAVPHFVYRPATGIGAVLSKQSDMDKGRRMRLRGRVLAADVNSDGRDEVVLPRNLTAAFLGGFSSAELLGFGWTGQRLDPLWSVKDIAGPVIDLRYGQDASGRWVSALVRTGGGLFTKERQHMMIYGLK